MYWCAFRIEVRSGEEWVKTFKYMFSSSDYLCLQVVFRSQDTSATASALPGVDSGVRILARIYGRHN
jgi:hypothetical protein